MRAKHHLFIIISTLLANLFEYGLAFFILFATYDYLPSAVSVGIVLALVAAIEIMLFCIIIPAGSITISTNYKKAELTIFLLHLVALIGCVIYCTIFDPDIQFLLSQLLPIIGGYCIFRCSVFYFSIRKDKRKLEINKIMELNEQLSFGNITEQECEEQKKNLFK